MSQLIWVASDRKLNICSFARYICRRDEEREVQPLANLLVSKATSSPVLFKHVCSSYTFASYFFVKLVCVIKWWRVKLLNNFIRVQIRKKLGFVQYAREIIPLFHEYACYAISYSYNWLQITLVQRCVFDILNVSIEKSTY